MNRQHDLAPDRRVWLHRVEIVQKPAEGRKALVALCEMRHLDTKLTSQNHCVTDHCGPDDVTKPNRLHIFSSGTFKNIII